MTILIISIIAVIVIYCLVIISRTTNTIPTIPTKESTIPTPPTISTNNKKKLIGPFSKTWTLTEFSKEFGSMQYNNHQVNHNTGTIFTSP